jgi:5-methylcytosine-specific restriction endonuclease McrA
MSFRSQIYNKTNGKCAYCGCVLNSKWHVDHVIPKKNFDYYKKKLNIEYNVNDICNLLAACQSCNNYKNTFLLEDFRNQISKLVERCNKYNAAYRIAKRFGLVTENEKCIVFYFEELQYEKDSK